MKRLLLLPQLLILSFVFNANSGCTTTTTTLPDGTKTTINSQDPKVVKAISSAVATAATEAAIQAIEDQANKQK